MFSLSIECSSREAEAGLNEDGPRACGMPVALHYLPRASVFHPDGRSESLVNTLGIVCGRHRRCGIHTGVNKG